MKVVQITPAFSVGDAVGENALAIHRYLIQKGIESKIMTLDIKTQHPAVELLDFDSLQSLAEKDVLIYHIAVATPLAEKVLKLRARKLVVFHNVTPPRFYYPFAPEIAGLLRKSLEEVEFFVEHQDEIDAFICDSEFNASQLRKLGARKCYTVPLVIDWGKFEKKPNPYYMKLFSDDRVNLLFVGRIVPNKKVEDLIKVVFYYKEAISPRVRLIIAGNTKSLEPYTFALKDLAERFFLRSDEVVFTGWVADEELIALYRVSDVFLSASEHEGFGVPFVEAMYFSLPIIAYDAGAVKETVGNGGIILKTKQPHIWGETIEELLKNQDLKKAIIENQKQRILQLRSQRSEEKLLSIIGQL